ncbi:MAG: hypothetical protein ACFFCY_03210 [Promethearchaeota archaeon]
MSRDVSDSLKAINELLKRLEEEMASRGSDEVIFERDYLYIVFDAEYVEAGRLPAGFEAYLRDEGIEVFYDAEVVGFRRVGVPKAFRSFLRRLLEEFNLYEAEEVRFERSYLYMLIDWRHVVEGRLKRAVEAYLGGAGIDVFYDGDVVRFRKRCKKKVQA